MYGPPSPPGVQSTPSAERLSRGLWRHLADEGIGFLLQALRICRPEFQKDEIQHNNLQRLQYKCTSLPHFQRKAMKIIIKPVEMLAFTMKGTGVKAPRMIK